MLCRILRCFFLFFDVSAEALVITSRISTHAQTERKTDGRERSHQHSRNTHALPYKTTSDTTSQSSFSSCSSRAQSRRTSANSHRTRVTGEEGHGIATLYSDGVTALTICPRISPLGHRPSCCSPASAIMCISVTASDAMPPHVSTENASICAWCCAAVRSYLRCFLCCLSLATPSTLRATPARCGQRRREGGGGGRRRGR